MYVVDYSKDDQVLSFSTKKEAAEFLHNNKKLCYYEGTASQEQSWSVSGIYVCSLGEYARPEYVLRRYKDGWVLKSVIFTIIVLYLHQRTKGPKGCTIRF